MGDKDGVSLVIAGAFPQPVHGDEDPARPGGAGGALQRRRRGSRLQPGLHALPEQVHPGQGTNTQRFGFLNVGSGDQ